MVTAFTLNQLMDAMAQAYLKALGTSASGLGIGEDGDTFGVADQISDAVAAIVFADDAEVQADLANAFLKAQEEFTTLEVCGDKLRPIVNRLSSHARKRSAAASISGVSDLDTLLTYWNTTHATKWQALQAPEWYSLYNAVRGGSRRPSVENLYFEVLQGATYANAVGKLVVTGAGAGDFTAGQTIDSAKYAGGHPCLNVSGLTGNGLVTVTGTQYDPATQTTTAGKTWTATVTANGRWYLAPGTADTDSLLIAVSAIGIAAGITAGTIYVEAERPVVRSGTSQAGSGTTITLDASASSLDDAYNGLTIGQAADQYTTRTITDYVGSTKVATVNSAWASNPSTTAFRIYRTKPS